MRTCVEATKAINNISSERMVSSKRALGDRGEARSLHRRRLERPQQEVTRFESRFATVSTLPLPKVPHIAIVLRFWSIPVMP